MKKKPNFAIISVALITMLFADVSLIILQLVPDANAILGVRRRAHRRGVVVGYTAGAAAASSAAASQAATAQQQAATAQQQSTTAQQQSATAEQQTAAAPTSVPPPSETGKPLPLGTVVSTLPAGCASKPVGGVEYYYCGGNYYRAAFQGNTLVYVTAKP